MPVARRCPAPVSDAWIKKAVEAALRGAKAKRVDEVGVVFVDDAEMISLNAAHRGKRKTTDVLSFGNDGTWAGEGGAGLLGDIVVSVPQVARQAAKAGKTLRQELALMLVHGTLHLLGYDHETLKDEKKMFALQKRILTTL
ncbi:MAG TPA: rRNA maturation RNase YbeY [Patescibacteria group bacterium]|nr:rRNA maturation RNase YbeY [Patescibacteria group bacterium]